MKSTKTTWPILATCCLLSGALGLAGCGGSTGTKPDGSAGSMPDGASPRADGVVSDTPMGIGGSGGGIGYDGPPGWGGSDGAVRGGATGVDANTSKSDSALGGAGGTTRATGGGAAGGSGGGGSLVGGGSAGRGGTSGTGGTLGKDAAVGDAQKDAALSPQVDGGNSPKFCQFGINAIPGGNFCPQLLSPQGKCRIPPETPAICTCDGSGSVHCNKQCPATPALGQACSTEFDECFYDSVGLCQCVQVAKADGTTSLAYSCPDAHPDAAPPSRLGSKVVACTDEPTLGTCVDPNLSPPSLDCGRCEIPGNLADYYCVQADGRSVCQCKDGIWRCPSIACPETSKFGDSCQMGQRCLDTRPSPYPDFQRVCRCVRDTTPVDGGTNNYFGC